MITFNLGKKYLDYNNLTPSDDEKKDKLKKKVILVQMLSSSFDYLICLHGSGFSKYMSHCSNELIDLISNLLIYNIDD